MKKFYLPFLMLLFLQLVGCASLVVGGLGQGGYQSSPADRAINKRVIAQLTSDRRLDASHISVNTYQGAVTLNGHVHSAASEQRAMTLTRSVQGVKRVISRLSIQPN